jgi:hypothetical protein
MIMNKLAQAHIHNINKSRASLLNMLKCNRPGIAQG